MSYWQHLGTGDVRATHGERPPGPGWVEISRAEYIAAKRARRKATMNHRPSVLDRARAAARRRAKS